MRKSRVGAAAVALLAAAYAAWASWWGAVGACRTSISESETDRVEDACFDGVRRRECRVSNDLGAAWLERSRSCDQLGFSEACALVGFGYDGLPVSRARCRRATAR